MVAIAGFGVCRQGFQDLGFSIRCVRSLSFWTEGLDSVGGKVRIRAKPGAAKMRKPPIWFILACFTATYEPKHALGSSVCIRPYVSVFVISAQFSVELTLNLDSETFCISVKDDACRLKQGRSFRKQGTPYYKTLYCRILLILLIRTLSEYPLTETTHRMQNHAF